MRKFAYWLFPSIAVIVAVFIVVFMIEINPNAPFVQGEAPDDSSAVSAEEKSGSGWINRFHAKPEEEYVYPVNEVTLKLDGNASAKSGCMYHLAVPLKDSYEFFCLKQELENHDLPYLLNEEGENMTVLVDSSDRSKLNELATKLKTYQISATLLP